MGKTCTSGDTRPLTEGQLQDKIRLALGDIKGLCLWRNNSGLADVRGHKIRYGVGNPGGADLIGIYLGRFVAVEIKTPIGRLSVEQRRFRDLVVSLGGIYIVLRSVDEAKEFADALVS